MGEREGRRKGGRERREVKEERTKESEGGSLLTHWKETVVAVKETSVSSSQQPLCCTASSTWLSPWLHRT